MSESKYHIEQTKHNKDFLNEIEDSIFYDWITTTIFYTALHYLDSFFDIFFNEHPQTHEERMRLLEEKVRNGKKFSKKIWKSYLRLMNDSKTARYYPDQWRTKLNKERIQTLLKDLEIVKNREM